MEFHGAGEYTAAHAQAMQRDSFLAQGHNDTGNIWTPAGIRCLTYILIQSPTLNHWSNSPLQNIEIAVEVENIDNI